jgi:Na+/H+ antiporter NhaD/arsenite permease-like protein
MDLPAWTAAPFALLLLAIAVLPLAAPTWWHLNRNKALVALGLSLPVVAYLVWHGPEATHALTHEWQDYVTFLVLLTALYTIAGGIALGGVLPGHPSVNVALLAVGAVLANVIGTTGASMVLVRPFLLANAGRDRVRHLPVFFIVVVSNTGGLLSPLGDPPLFLGFLQGVDFFWTLRLWPQWLAVNATLLTLFYAIDRVQFGRETRPDTASVLELPSLRTVHGWKLNVPLMAGVVIAVLAQKIVPRPAGEAALVALTLASLAFTPKSVRGANKFGWGPIVEVAVVFAGIFTTMVPALLLLKQHGGAVPLTEPWQFFWVTGLLSSVLDNAPTYLTLGTLAAGGNDLGWLAAQKPGLLAAVSCGAVFMGANTYIGNGPNFMVKAIAEDHGYTMPSFFGYTAFTAAVLLPVFAAVTLAFFRG